VQVNLGHVYGSPTERYTTFSGYLLYWKKTFVLKYFGNSVICTISKL
jgi:hypothetical protein